MLVIPFRKYLLALPDVDVTYVDLYLDLVLGYPEQPQGTYTELHHILTRSLFPEFRRSRQNLVPLRGRDHLLAHFFLARALPTTPSAANAYLNMVNRDSIPAHKKLSRGHHLTPQDLPIPAEELLAQYEASRSLWAAHMRQCLTVRDRKTGKCLQIPRDQMKPEQHAHLSTGLGTYKDPTTGATRSLPVDHPDVLSGKVTHVNKGMTRAIDLTTQEVVHIPSEEFRSDPTRYAGTNRGVPSGYQVNVGQVPILDEAGMFRWISKDHPDLADNLASGRWSHHLKGKLTVKLATGGPSFNVDVDDPRLLTGEIVPQSKGMATVVPAGGGKAFQVPKDDPRIASGELVAQNSGRVRVLDAEGRECRVYPDDPRLATGELRLKVLKRGNPKVNVYDATGKLWKVYADDPRITSGEFAPKADRKVRWDKGLPQRNPHRRA